MSLWNIIGILWLPVWFLSGFLTLKILERRLEIQRSKALPYINLAALFCGPVVLLVLLAFRSSRSRLHRLLKQLRLNDGIRMSFRRDGETISETHIERLAPRTIRRTFKKALLRGVAVHASDLLVEPLPDGSAVMRIKIQGSLQNLCRLSADDAAALLRLTVFLSGIEPGTEPAGEIRLEFCTSRNVSALRIGMLKVGGGTRLSFHFVQPEHPIESTAELGLDAIQTNAIRQFLAIRRGLIVIAGDHGSGRSLALERLLDLADLRNRSAILVSHSEPVKLRSEVMRLDGSGRITVNTIYAALQQSPDLLAVDEVTDQRIFSALLTAARGNMLVIAVIRTGTLAETMQRLIAFAPSPKAFVDTLRLIIQLHTLRRLCRCAQPAVLTPEESSFLHDTELPADQVRQAAGCAECSMTGYLGHTAAFELCSPGNALLPILTGSEMPTPMAIRRALEEELGEYSGYLAACRTAALGLTSMEEASTLLPSTANQG